MSVVHLHKATHTKDIRQVLDKIDLQIDSDHVFIKPNIVIPTKPSSGVITDPALVQGLIDYLRNRGIQRITIGESPGLLVDVKEAFRVSGFEKLSKENSIELLDLSKVEVVELKWPFGKLTIPRIALDAYYINVAKLKTHMNTTVTLGLKNQKGLISDNLKKLIHLEGLHQPIVELAKAVKPNLTIIDGIVGIEGDGPLLSGKKISSNVIILSNDVVAADAIACKVMGINPLDVEHLRLAHQAGIGIIDPQIEGEDVSDVMMSFKRANETRRQIFKLTNWRNPRACSMCGDCFSTAMKQIITTPRLVISTAPKLAYGVLFEGIDIVSGHNATIPSKHGKILCLGRCTRQIAEENGFVWVEGCPPLANDIVDGIRRL